MKKKPRNHLSRPRRSSRVRDELQIVVVDCISITVPKNTQPVSLWQITFPPAHLPKGPGPRRVWSTGACSRFFRAPLTLLRKRRQAGRTPNASRGSLPQTSFRTAGETPALPWGRCAFRRTATAAGGCGIDRSCNRTDPVSLADRLNGRAATVSRANARKSPPAVSPSSNSDTLLTGQSGIVNFIK
jgi:hypothetical protein